MEKRKVERFDLNLEAFVREAGQSFDTKPSRLKTRDVSMNGACLLTPEPLPVDTKVSVDVIISIEGLAPNETGIALIEASGSVLPTDNEGMTIRFDETFRFLPYSR